MTERKIADLPESMAEDVAVVATAAADLSKSGVLLIGPPGCGKTMLASRVAELLPAVPVEMVDRVRAIQFRAYASAGLIDHRTSTELPALPFRAPHHTVSEAGLCGGSCPHAYYSGEVALAAGGVLMLDELGEFRRSTIERLTERMRLMHLRPVRPFLVAASNPCACGWHGFPLGGRECKCPVAMVERYMDRVTTYARLLKLTIHKTVRLVRL